MTEVKVPAKLHLMSKASQKAWYKKNNMEMPSTTADGKSAAQAKKDVGEINKKKAREATIAAAVATSKKNKELMKSSDRVRQMAANAKAFGGQRPGGDLTTASGMVNYIRSGGYLKAGRLGEETVEEAVVKTKDVNKQKLKNYVRGLGTKAAIAGKVPFDQINSPLRAGRKVLKQEEVQIDEVTKKEAESTLGGTVKEKPKMPPGKQPAGYRYVRGLARKAMKAGIKKEEVSVDEERKPDASMAMTNTLKMKMLSDKDKKTLGKVADLMTSQKKKFVKEGVNMKYIEEKLTASDPASKWISDFVKSDNPKFAGKSKKERINQALGAYYAAKRGTNEEVEQVDEQSPAEIKAKYYHDQFDKVKPVKAYDKEGKLVGRYRSMDHAKQMKPGHTYKVEEEVEQIDEMDKSQPAAGRDSDTPFPTKPIKVTDKQRASAKLMTRELLNQAKKQLKKEEVVTEAEGKVAESMDAVGREDKDVDNDGDSDKTDLYLSKRRKAIGNAIRKKVAGKMEK